MSDPPTPAEHPPPTTAPAATPTPEPTSAAAGGAGEDGGGRVPAWLVVAIVIVVVVVVGAVVALLVLGGDDDGDGDEIADLDGSLPAQVSTDDATTPVVQMLAGTAWDLDGSAVTTSFGNTCGYQGPESFIACTLIGGNPAARRDLPGADLLNTAEISDQAVAPGLAVAQGAELVGSSFEGCPGSIRLTGVDEPIGPGPAVCVRTDQSRIFAVYLTHVTPAGALSLIAVEVSP